MPGPRNISGLTQQFYFYRLWLHMMVLAFKEYRSLSKFIFVTRELLRMKRKFAGKQRPIKGVLSGNRFYWHINIPGYPSDNFDNHYRGTLNKFLPVKSAYNHTAVLYFGITRKCPLYCRHCYDYEKLNSDDALPLEELKMILDIFQEQGLGQVLILGGEPMARFDDLVGFLDAANHSTEFWVSTSGYQVSKEKAMILKKAGLNGMAISLDHFSADEHNAYRGHPQAFAWAMNATDCAVESGLMTCWSVCVSNDFISWNNLLAYSRFAASKRVNFIQIFEPMPVGRYDKAEVTIKPDKLQILEDFFLKMNHDPAYGALPIVIYPGYHQRRTGCLAAGERSLYVDSEGNAHPCPFCRSKQPIKVHTMPLADILDALKSEGCRFY